ncbi:Trs120-domain-containing protein [Nadsonia fulvescens var. elongata DSM 6958]|uniref:Trs120-domain-containing protein n=1 Tax=Nadsonia fulvescens var. elongata DSM 6958 TaxID=857566 RepID=A0A1E3PSN1_9ASCO|nr:Trs120-domain-containing protein [Nadsonia fulvescens var. elongata DSM 6958]
MFLDEYSFLSPSRVRCTVYPLGGIKKSFFVKNVERLQRLREVCLVDVSPPSDSHKSMFSPQGFPNGRVVYDISMSKVEDKAKAYLEDLEPWRRTLCVFAVTAYDTDRSNTELKRYINRLREKHPRAILHKVLIFSTPNEIMNDESLLVNNGIIYVPSQRSSVVTSLETIMCDITADFLSKLSILVLSYQSSVLKSPNVKEMELLSGVNNNQSISFTATFKPTISSHSPSNSSILLPNASSGPLPGSKTYGGSSAVSPSDKLKLRAKARQGKLLAHFYLLSGRVNDAFREFTETVNICRSIHDHLWCGSALEGVIICMVILSSLNIPFSIPVAISSFISASSSIASTSGTTHLLSLPHRNSSGDVSKSGDVSPAMLLGFLPELFDSILKLYVKSQALADESVPQLVFCETLLRCTKLLTVAHLCGGLNEIALSAIFHQEAIEPKRSMDCIPVGLSKADINSWVNKLLFTDLSTLPVPYQCQIMCGVASVYSNLGMDRKASLILRSVFTTITPNLIHTDATSGKGHTTGTAKDNLLPYVGGKNETGLTDVLDSMIKIYSAGNVIAKGYGWSTLKKESLSMCVEVCDTVGNLQGIIYFGSLLLSTSADILTSNEQQNVLSKIKLSVKRSEEFGSRIDVPYWDPLILRGIRVLQPSGGGQYPPLKKSKDIILDETDDSDDDEESQASGAIIFNPFASRTPGSQSIESKEGVLTLVENEKIEFAVKLQNPFHFNLNLESVIISTMGGVELECNRIKVLLLANTVSEVIIACTPRGTGDLTVTGCEIAIIEGIKGPYKFGICSGVIVSRQERIKVIGKNSSNEIVSQDKKLLISGSPVMTTVSFPVIPKQPILSVNHLSLEEKCVALLIGEKRKFQIGIKNLSAVDINAMLLVFNDSTVKPLKQVLGNFDDIPPNEIYEIEYFLHNRQALKWLRSATCPEENNLVVAGFDKELEIEILGKRGMVDASIKIEYCNIPADQEQQSRLLVDGESWVRDLVVPINVTVHASIEFVSFDIVALQPGFRFGSGDTSNFLSEFFDNQLNLETIDMSEFCLMTIDLRNCWTCPMEVSLVTQIDNQDSCASGYTITAVINPSCTSRFLIPIKRIHLSSHTLRQLIPSLSGRQFVVNNVVNNEQDRSMRELFWYREELFKNLRGTWHEIPESRFDIRNNNQNSNSRKSTVDVSKYGRTGEVELRGIRLTPDMIKVLQVSPIDVVVRIEQVGDDQKKTDAVTKDHIDKNMGQSVIIRDGSEFVKVFTKITNNTDRNLRLILRSIPYIATSDITTGVSTDGKLQEVSTRQLYDIDSRILFNGVLQKTIPQVLGPGQSFTNQLGALFLSRGEYKWTSVVEEITPENEVIGESRTHIQRKPLDIYVK